MRTWLSNRLRPPIENQKHPPRDEALEGLRGICALLVVYTHAFLPGPVLDPFYVPPAGFFWWFEMGYAAVLIFFTLSGYVIGLTVRQPISAPLCGQYLQRRVMRLLPVAYIGILLGWLIQRHGVDGRTLVGNFLFLQNDSPYPVVGWHFPRLLGNAPLWTLNYEAFYYLLFIVVWWLGPPAIVIFASAALCTFGPAWGLAVPEMISRYACGACYWMSGLVVAWFVPVPPAPEARRSHWPSAFLCAYVLWRLAGLKMWLQDAGISFPPAPTSISPDRLDFLPVCLWCLLAVTGRSPAAQKILAIVCLGWSWLGLACQLFAHQGNAGTYIAGGALLVASLLMIRPPASLAGLRRMAPIGAVSFGIYVFAWPFQFGLHEVLPAFSGTPLTFGMRLLVVLGATIGLAWLVDFRLHAWLANRLRRTR
jgi:peptidoglycan/LPS O-acetylase OafA/YrhL